MSWPGPFGPGKHALWVTSFSLMGSVLRRVHRRRWAGDSTPGSHIARCRGPCWGTSGDFIWGGVGDVCTISGELED